LYLKSDLKLIFMEVVEFIRLGKPKGRSTRRKINYTTKQLKNI